MLFHVSSTSNRNSIMRYGLDSSRMGAARGIAGSDYPEVDGVFLCRDEREAGWFIRMNNTGGPVDVWAIAGIDEGELVVSPEGHYYVPRPVPREQLTLVRQDLPPDRMSD